jgi:hypothetical protein
MSEAQDFVGDLAADDAGTVLLQDIRDLFQERGVDRMASAEIVEALGKREDWPWSKWKDGKPITPRQFYKSGDATSAAATRAPERGPGIGSAT